MATKTSGTFVGFGTFLIVVVGAFYILHVHNWYWNHSAIICSTTEVRKARPGDFCSILLKKCLVEPKTTPNDPVGNHVNDLLVGSDRGCPNEEYEAIPRWWGNDIISNFIVYVIALISKDIYPWFNNDFAQKWNEFFSDESTRKVIGSILALLYGAFATRVIYLSVDWLHEKFAGPNN